MIVFMFLVLGCDKPLDQPKDYNITCYAATYGKGIYKTVNGGMSWYPLEMDQKDLYAYFKRIYPDHQSKDIFYITTTGAGFFKLELKEERLYQINRFKDDIINSITFEESSPMVGTNNKGIFESDSELKNWNQKNKGLIYHDVNILANLENNLFAGTVKDLFVWDKSSYQWLPASKEINNKNIISLAGDDKGKVMFAGSGAYDGKRGRFDDIPCLYKSIDQGKTWAVSDKGIPDGTLIYVISINPNNPERIYLGTSDGIYFSSDAGQNWEKMKQGLPKGLKVFDIRIARIKDGADVVYAAGSRGVYMTTDDEKTGWVGKSYGLEQTAITSIVLMQEGE